MADVTSIPAALRFCSVIPLRPGSKVPAVEKARADAAAVWEPGVDEYLASGQGHRVGVLMGGKLVVLDADLKMDYANMTGGVTVITRNGLDDITALMQAAGISKLPPTLRIKTQGGGQHIYFRQNARARVRQTRIGYLDVKAAPNSYCAIGAGYELIEDTEVLPEIPEALAHAINNWAGGTEDRSKPVDREGGDIAAYGNASSAFNNALTAAKGYLVQLGWPEQQAAEAVRRLNEVSDDPISDERFESTVGRDKGWVPGEAAPESLYRWADRLTAGEPVDQALTEEVFRDLTSYNERYKQMFVDIAYRQWAMAKLREGPADLESWRPLDLTSLLGADAAQPMLPSMLARADDGQHLFYPGATHWIWGEPGHGKTILCLLWAAELMKQGRHVIWVDLESQAKDSVERLLTLCGCTRSQLLALLHLVQPAGAFSRDTAGIALEMLALNPALLVVDAANDLITLHGGRHNDVDPVGDMDQWLLRPVKESGASVAVIDHVAKNTEKRNSPINSGHKKAVADAGFAVTRVAPFTRSQAGYSKIVSHKDRKGAWPDDHEVGYLVVQNGTASVRAMPPFSVLVTAEETPGARQVRARQERRALENTADLGAMDMIRRELQAHPEESDRAIARRLEEQTGLSVATIMRRLKILRGD